MEVYRVKQDVRGHEVRTLPPDGIEMLVTQALRCAASVSSCSGLSSVLLFAIRAMLIPWFQTGPLQRPP